MKKNTLFLSILLVFFVGIAAWIVFASSSVRTTSTAILPEPYINLNHNEPITPIPETVNLDPRKVALGGQLFHDPRLSSDNTVACATCHILIKGGMDGAKRSRGVNNQIGEINTPTVFNCGFNFRQFWDGRAVSLEDQIDGPIFNPKELNSNWNEVIAKLSQEASYVVAFNEIYNSEIHSNNIKDAIATFERSLITPNSRFDSYLRGKTDVLTSEEVEGYQRFKGYGCIACHQGVNVGDNLFERLGIMKDYFKERGNIETADLGRFNVTGIESDTHVFKVPGLRNVALTAPYFHDGSVATLDSAVLTMGKYQLGVDIPQADVQLIVKFLHTLTGEYEGKPL